MKFLVRGLRHDPISIYEFIECFSEKLTGEIIVTGSSGLSVEVFYTHFKTKLVRELFDYGTGCDGVWSTSALGASEATIKKLFFLRVMVV